MSEVIMKVTPHQKLSTVEIKKTFGLLHIRNCPTSVGVDSSQNKWLAVFSVCAAGLCEEVRVLHVKHVFFSSLGYFFLALRYIYVEAEEANSTLKTARNAF